MSTTFIGKSVAPRGRLLTYPYQINSTGLKTGAALVYDSSAAGQLLKAPAGAAALGFAGLLVTEYMAGSASVAGQDCEVQRAGVGQGILASGSSCTVGVELVIAGTDGSLRPFVLGSDDDCDIVGTAEITLSTVGINTPIPVNLDNKGVVHKDAS
jgi:hypothetical protein